MLWDPEDENKLSMIGDSFSSLIKVVEREGEYGEYGYKLLYMCIYQSRDKTSTHADALKILDAMGKCMQRVQDRLIQYLCP